MKTSLTKLFMAIAIVGMSLTVAAQNNTDVKQKIEKYNKEMADAMIKGDNDKILSLYSQDVISLPNNDKMIHGIAELRKANEEMDKSGWKIKSYNPNIISVESNGNVVNEIGTYKMDVAKEGTGDTRHIEGKYLTIWEKQNDGSLKIKTEIWNHDSEDKTAMSEMNEPSGRDFEGKNDMDKDHMDMKKNMNEQNPEGHDMTDEKK
ncbi:MAG TPA: nuclear transport factor 2 family protein [Lentimicrobium sp.]|nr:nuclear transport factor 2 family protein [Lentimicrobium sp.]